MKTRENLRPKPNWAFGLRLILTLSLSAFLRPLDVKADGGIVLLRQTQGPFTVTVFTPAEILAESASNVAVLVQDRETAKVILDADVDLRLAPPRDPVINPKREFCGVENKVNSSDGSGVVTSSLYAHAAHCSAAAKFLYSAPLAFPEAGVWNLNVRVARDGQTADIPGSLVVKVPFSRLSGAAPYLFFPLIVIGLFFVNLWLRECREGRGRSGSLIVFEADKTTTAASNV
jgi:hypothetical protein